MEPAQTLHDFALNLLTDTDAMSAFDSDPAGALKAAGLGDITAGDVQEILPLVQDYAADLDATNGLSGITSLDAARLTDTDTNLGGLAANTTAMAEHLTGDLGVGGLGIDDLGLKQLGVDDLGGNDLDSSVLNEVTAGHNAVQGVTGAVSGVVGGDLGEASLGDVNDLGAVDDVSGAVTSGNLHVTDALDLDSTIDDTIGDVTGNLSSNPVTTAPSDVASDSGNLTGNLSQIHDVVGDVGLNGDVTGVGAVTDVVGDLGDVNIGGIANGNDVDF
ncbi:IniB N-terminal domain-containing protein [Actinophytocola sp. NPDC049390]|uniref:IniB N-terminal domain-containing protein n=1 Tax=Actinophytocola sp. NPDC049390 TaxID=3363894 RepID=UPI00378D460B